MDDERPDVEALAESERVGRLVAAAEMLGRSAPRPDPRPRVAMPEDDVMKANRAVRRWRLGDIVVREPTVNDHHPVHLLPAFAEAIGNYESVPVLWWYPMDENRVVAITRAGAVLYAVLEAGGVTVRTMRRPDVDEREP